MRIRISGLLLTVLFLAAGPATHAGDLHLLDFELEDQFGNLHRRVDVQGTIVLLNGSDKGGVQFNVTGPAGGTVHESASKSTNLLLFAPDGSLVHHAAGRELDEETLEKLVTALRSLLDEIQEGDT